MNGNLKFNPSLVQAGLASAIRTLTILVTGFTALLGLLQRRDLAGLYNYVQSTEGLTVITAAIAVITFAYGLYLKLRERKALTVAEPQASNLTSTAKSS